MTTLRITQAAQGDHRFRIEIALEGEGVVPQSASAAFKFEQTPQDAEDLRWYLEDYLQYPHDPAPDIAARIERRSFCAGALQRGASLRYNGRDREKKVSRAKEVMSALGGRAGWRGEKPRNGRIRITDRDGHQAEGGATEAAG